MKVYFNPVTVGELRLFTTARDLVAAAQEVREYLRGLIKYKSDLTEHEIDLLQKIIETSNAIYINRSIFLDDFDDQALLDHVE